MAADREPGAEPAVSVAVPVLVMVTLELRVSAVISSVTYSGLPGRPVGELQEVAVGSAAGQGGHQVGHRRPGEPGELEPGGAAGHPPQRQQVLALRHRAHHPDQQQRHLPRRSRQPSPQGDAGRVGPLQVIDHQDERPHRALFRDQRQQLLRQHGRHVRAAVGGDLTAQQPDDRLPPGVRRRLADPQPVQERQQRQCLAQLIPGPPEHLAARLRRLRHRRPHQRGLADARLALDEHRTATPPRHLFYQPGQQRHLAVTVGQRTGQRHRGQLCRGQAGRSSYRGLSWRGRGCRLD